MKITHKLVLGFFLVGFFVVLTGMTGIIATSLIGGKVNLITQITSPTVQTVDDLNIVLVKNNQVIHSYMEEYDNIAMNNLRRAYDEQNDLFDESERNFRKLVEDEGIIKQFNLIAKKYDLFKEKAEKIIGTHDAELAETDELEQKRYREVGAAFLKQLDDDTREAAALLEEIAVEVDARNQAANKASIATVRNTRILLFLITMLGLAVAGVIGFFFTKLLVQPMHELIEGAKKVGEGNFDVQVKEVQSHDELGNLTSTFNKMVESLRNMIEESPKLKKFMELSPSAEKTSQEKEKYIMVTGTSYLIKETDSKKAFHIFLDKVTHGCQGLCLSRTNPELIKKQYGLQKTPILWLSDARDENTLASSDLLIIGKMITDFLEKSQKSIVLLDRIDYLIARHGFEEVLKFIIKLNDKIMVTDAIFLVPVDPAVIKQKEFSFLEKEMQQLPSATEKLDLGQELRDILYFVHNTKRLGKQITFKDIGQHFSITAPTTQKRLLDLHNQGLIRIVKMGRNKVLELTEKGYEAVQKQ